MGKTKLLNEVKIVLERIKVDAIQNSLPAFNVFFGIADAANKSQKLYPWRRVFRDLFQDDRARTAAASELLAPSGSE
jgi:hypothetical protein